MQELGHGSVGAPGERHPLSVHFINNALAAAASYIESEPETARDVLAELGAFLSHRLRATSIVPLAQEFDHVATYLRLERARFPGRIDSELPPPDQVPSGHCVPGDVQGPLSDALSRWMRERSGRVRLALRMRRAGATLEFQLDDPDDPGAAGERVRIPLSVAATSGEAA